MPARCTLKLNWDTSLTKGHILGHSRCVPCLQPQPRFTLYIRKKKYCRSLTGEGCCRLVCMCRLQSMDRFRKIIILINSRWWWWVNNTSLMRKKIHYRQLSSSHISRDASRVFKYRKAHECKAVWVHLLISKSQRDGVDHNLMLIAVQVYFSEPKRLRAQAMFGNIVLKGALNSSALSEDICRVKVQHIAL